MRRAAALILTLFAAGAHAHPGHVDGPLWHLLTEPDHLALILLPLAVAAGIGLYRRRKNGARAEDSGRKKIRP